MKNLVIFGLLAVLLTACVVTPSASDPYAMRAYGESLQQAADAQIFATQQAIEIERQRLEMQATGTQQAYALRATQAADAQAAQYTADAVAHQSTQAAAQLTQQAQQIQSTQTVESMQATATVQAVEATQVAIALAVDYQRQLHEKQVFWLGLREFAWTLFLIVILVMTGLTLWIYVPRFLDWIIEWQDRRNSLFNTPDGTAAFILGPDNVVHPMLLVDANHFRPRRLLSNGSAARQIPPVTLSANKVTATGPLPKQDHAPVNMAAIDLLRRSNPEGDQLLPCDKSGIRQEVWIQITDALAHAGLVRKEPGSGTFVIDGTCKDVLYKLETRQVVLPPTPLRYSELT